MESKQKPKNNIQPPPPQHISKENLSLWIGWTHKTNRELIREAASKGHIPLAQTFLNLKTHTPIEEVEDFIKKEVFIWVDELLERKLLFRISKVLQSIGSDPIAEFQKFFYKTKVRDLREHIAIHLKKNNKLTREDEKLWILLDIIIDNRVITHQYNLDDETIEGLSRKSDSWREEVAAKLFVNIHDNRLNPLLNAEILWNQLCNNDEVDLLKSWIQISFAAIQPDTSDINENLVAVFQTFDISNKMINQLLNPSLPTQSTENVLNELAKLGLFIDQEKDHFLQVISRINSADSLQDIYSIFSQDHANISPTRFIGMLDKYCSEFDFLSILNAYVQHLDVVALAKEIKSPHLTLMADLHGLVKQFNENLLCDNIYQVAKYLFKDNVEQYFCNQPLVFLSLLLFKHNVDIEKAVLEKALNLFGTMFSRSLECLFQPNKLLGKLYLRKIKSVQCNLNYFDLLKKHKDINVTSVYSFRFNRQDVPNFNSRTLRSSQTYSKKLNYTFYLKLCRPVIASRFFYIDLLKNFGCIDEKHKQAAKEKIHKIAIYHFNNRSLTSSCISFLELVGVNSQSLRIILSAANLLHHTNSQMEITSLFLNIEENACVIQALLEQSISELIDFPQMKHSGKEFIYAMKIYDIAKKFSELYHLPRSESFLVELSQNNLWFPFLLYAQIKDYPVANVRSLCPNFRNPNLLEHIVHSVAHDIQVKETNVLMQERDSRKHYLLKLGVGPTVQKSGETVSVHSRTSCGSCDVNFSSFTDDLEIDLANIKATLLQMLIWCHSSSDPPKAMLQACYFYKNSLLAILATNYEPTSIITNWLTWLSISAKLPETYSSIEAHSTNPQAVSDILNNSMTSGYAKTLLESLIVFLPDNPLTPFVDALCDIIIKDHHMGYLTTKLNLFTEFGKKMRISAIIKADLEMTYKNNKIWIEKTAIRLLSSALIYHTTSYADQIQFVTLLCDLQIQSYFILEVPNFKVLLHILEILSSTKVWINLKKYLDESKRTEAVECCINDLIKNELFAEALKIAKLAKASTHFIVLKKWQKKYEQRSGLFQDFLGQCNQDFKKEKVSVEYAISFFKERVTINDIERYFLLKCSHKWAIEHKISNKYELEKKKIISFINIPNNTLPIDELSEFDNLDGYVSFKEMVKELHNIYPVQENLSDETIGKLNQILISFLDQGKLWTALKLEKMFGCDNTNMEILKLCHELAEDIVQPNQLTENQKVLFTIQSPPKRYARSLRFRTVSMSSDKNYQDWMNETNLDESFSQDTLILIHTLVQRMTHGMELGYDVFMKYRISRNIEVPYGTVIACADPLNILKNALQEDCTNKLDVVNDFLEVFEFSKDQMTDFVCEQFVKAASDYAKSKYANFVMWEVRMDTNFHVVLKLFKNEGYTLGYKFYNYAVAVHEQQVTADLNFKISEMGLVVELLIAAHFCFTNDCNMEGISIILRKCRTVISHLLAVRSWKLIVRLFTGVARYSELNFVFDILKENHQFEFLLSRGCKRDDHLKQASFEYIKKQCPAEKELFRLVAIRFGMYSDIADLCEKEGESYIRQILATTKNQIRTFPFSDNQPQYYTLKKNDDIKKLLNKTMDTYVLAAEYHMEGQKLGRGLYAARQAELVALQKSLFVPLNQNEKALCLFDLNNTQILSLICGQLNFYQSNILIEAYSYDVDWSTVLYERTIKNNDGSYFDSYMEVLGINEKLVQDIVRKYIASNVKDRLSYKNMMYIISHLSSVHSKYRIASEIGFSNLVEELISGGQITYLKDTVWKKGYRHM